MFANDVVICAPKLEEAEDQLEEWRKALEDRGMSGSLKRKLNTYTVEEGILNLQA